MLSHSPFSPLLCKLSLLLAILLICLSRPPTVRHDSLNLRHITPLFSKMKAFLSRQTSPSPFCTGPRSALLLLVALFATFLSYLYTSDCGASCMSSRTLARRLCRLSKIRIWNIYECMNIFIVEKPMCMLESLISCSGPALEWSGVILEGAPLAATK